jgi:hypothetical protein
VTIWSFICLDITDMTIAAEACAGLRIAAADLERAMARRAADAAKKALANAAAVSLDAVAAVEGAAAGACSARAI